MLSAALQQLAQDLHGVADAADRLRDAPSIDLEISAAPSDAALTDAAQRQQLQMFIAEVIAQVRRQINGSA